MPPVVRLARQLYLERMDELKAHIKVDEDSFRKLVTEIDEIRSGKWDNKLKELIPDLEMASNEPTPMQITDDNPAQPVHPPSEVNGDVVSMTPADESPIKETKSDLGLPDQVSSELDTANSLLTEDTAVTDDDINMELNTPAVTTSADSVKESEISSATADVAEKPELTEVSGLTSIDDTTILPEDQEVSAEPTPSTPAEEVAVRQDLTMEEETVAIDEIPAIAHDEDILEEVVDEQVEISSKRKHDDIDMMSVDASPKRARTQSKSPMPNTESIAEVITPNVDIAVAGAIEQTPEKKAATPAAASEELGWWIKIFTGERGNNR
jgi:bromodomain-containing protein 8